MIFPVWQKRPLCLPRARGKGALALPAADEARAPFPQRSKNTRISVRLKCFSGTARWTGSAKCRMRSPRSRSSTARPSLARPLLAPSPRDLSSLAPPPGELSAKPTEGGRRDGGSPLPAKQQRKDFPPPPLFHVQLPLTPSGAAASFSRSISRCRSSLRSSWPVSTGGFARFFFMLRLPQGIRSARRPRCCRCRRRSPAPR